MAILIEAFFDRYFDMVKIGCVLMLIGFLILLFQVIIDGMNNKKNKHNNNNK